MPWRGTPIPRVSMDLQPLFGGLIVKSCAPMMGAFLSIPACEHLWWVPIWKCYLFMGYKMTGRMTQLSPIIGVLFAFFALMMGAFLTLLYH